MRIEKGNGLVVEISMKCNCDCNKKDNEDNFENEMLDKDGVLDLISSFEDYILDVNRYARFTLKKVEIERTSGEMIDIIKDFEKTYSLKENKMENKIYVVLEDVDEAYNSIIAFSNCEKAEKYVLKHSTPETRLIIDEVVLDER